MLGLIRKKELKRLLDYLEAVERNYCDESEKDRILLSGILTAIYGVAEYFGIKLYSMEKDGDPDGYM